MEITIYNQNVWGWGNLSGEGRIASRNYGIRALVTAHDADICTFQECSKKIVRAGEAGIEHLLSDAYDEVPTPAGTDNFTPIFYRRSRFARIDQGYMLFEGRNDLNSKSITWAVFEERTSGLRFAACSTHFWWKAECIEDHLQRMENAAVLLEQMHAIQAKYDVPVFAAGDLNCGKYASQGEEPYLWLCEHLLDARLHADETTDGMTHHPYPRCDEDNLYHATSQEAKKTLDHIFVCEDPRVHLLRFSVDASPVAHSTSDHFPLILRARIEG